MPTKTLRGDLRFHPIGQGLFYTGRIQFGKRPPDYFFYDCGSTTDSKHLKQIIESWKRAMEHDRIELGIISHMDADHVNGLGTLLDGAITCGTVVLPYLNPWQRIAIAARAEGAPDAYFEFTENPAQFLFSRGVDRVIFMGGNSNWGERNESPGPIDDDRPPHGDSDGPPLETRSLRKWPCDDPAMKGEFVRAGDLSSSSAPAVQELCASDRVSLVMDEGHVSLRQLWQFHFFQYGFDHRPSWSDEKRWEAFRSDITKAIGTTDPHYVLGRLRNRKARAQIREAYYHLQKDHNNASIAVWHGPLRRGSEARITASGFRVEGRRYSHPLEALLEGMHGHSGFQREEHYLPGQNGDLGTLLTGDISLKHDFPAFWGRFSPFMDQTSIVSLPHHGSFHSWNPDFMKRYTRMKQGDALFVASVGATNSYGHPHLAVVSDIQRACPVTKVTESDPGLDVAIQCHWQT